MPLLKTKTQVQTRLSQAFPSTKIAYEAVDFEPPEELYLRVQFLPGLPTDSVYGTKYYRENVRFNIFVVAPGNQGTSAALTFAESIRELFDKGTAIDYQNIRIHVFRKPQIAGTAYVEGRVVVPVYVSLVIEVNE